MHNSYFTADVCECLGDLTEEQSINILDVVCRYFDPVFNNRVNFAFFHDSACKSIYDFFQEKLAESSQFRWSTAKDFPMSNL